MSFEPLHSGPPLHKERPVFVPFLDLKPLDPSSSLTIPKEAKNLSMIENSKGVSGYESNEDWKDYAKKVGIELDLSELQSYEGEMPQRNQEEF
jgi:hypothetical protein